MKFKKFTLTKKNNNKILTFTTFFKIRAQGLQRIVIMRLQLNNLLRVQVSFIHFTSTKQSNHF